MSDIASALRQELRDKEYSEGYAESFLNSYIATQIKVLREQRGMSQPQLAALIGTTQPGISRIENVNYSSWNIGTLKKLARAFNVRLKVSFEQFGTLPEEAEGFTRASLERLARENDPGLLDAPVFLLRAFAPTQVYSVSASGMMTPIYGAAGVIAPIKEGTYSQPDTVTNVLGTFSAANATQYQPIPKSEALEKLGRGQTMAA